MVPNILDVAVETLENPLAGMGVAVMKIAEKATRNQSLLINLDCRNRPADDLLADF
jgi:hypothetical protein